MFMLLADRTDPEWSGIVGSEIFDDMEAAECTMRRWARFGIDNHCNDPDNIWIADAEGAVLRVWDWRRRAPVDVPASPPQPEGA